MKKVWWTLATVVVLLLAFVLYRRWQIQQVKDEINAHHTYYRTK